MTLVLMAENRHQYLVLGMERMKDVYICTGILYYGHSYMLSIMAYTVDTMIPCDIVVQGRWFAIKL